MNSLIAKLQYVSQSNYYIIIILELNLYWDTMEPLISQSRRTKPLISQSRDKPFDKRKELKLTVKNEKFDGGNREIKLGKIGFRGEI